MIRLATLLFLLQIMMVILKVGGAVAYPWWVIGLPALGIIGIPFALCASLLVLLIGFMLMACVVFGIAFVWVVIAEKYNL